MNRSSTSFKSELSIYRGSPGVFRLLKELDLPAVDFLFDGFIFVVPDYFAGSEQLYTVSVWR
jgi:hypothetical protein